GARRPVLALPLHADGRPLRRTLGAPHLAPLLELAERRPDLRAARGPRRRTRNPRGAHGAPRSLCRALHDAGIGVSGARARARRRQIRRRESTLVEVIST